MFAGLNHFRWVALAATVAAVIMACESGAKVFELSGALSHPPQLPRLVQALAPITPPPRHTSPS